MKSSYVVGICCTLLVLGMVPSALAMPKFKAAFEKKYIQDHKDETFKAAVKKESCNVCHVKGEKKDVHNAYGKALADLIEGNAQTRIKEAADKKAEEEKVLAELEAAFSKTEAAHCDKEDDKSPTFGDLIKSGKLPGGDAAK